ncbi:MAG TPA: hypothetical protein VFE30_10205 [Anaeromyxobacteraceae bacterium]|nr:hypothetical protein [Anaeromyxobacteraceae bacterium]
MQKFGTNGVAKSPLAIVPPPADHEVRAALHDLNDPERRLIHEFFWFWPLQLGQTNTDPALRLLDGGNVEGAAGAWAQSETGSEAFVAIHNLAVLDHCLALDLEAEASKRPLSHEERERLARHWEGACRRWGAVIQHEAFWSRLSSRIRSLEDPRLTTGLARRIRIALPNALLSVNATLAVRAAERGDMATAKRHVDTMRHIEGNAPGLSQGIGPATRHALQQSLVSLRKRVRSICEDLEARVDADPLQGERVTRELIEQTKPLIAAFDALLGSGDATRDAVRDEVAAAALGCQIPYGNKTKNWRTSLQLLDLIKPVAAGRTMQARVDDNVKTVRENVEIASCWFCRENDAVPAAAHSVAMYGDVSRQWGLTGTKVQWRRTSVSVPRCRRCQETHDHSSSFTLIGAVMGLLAGGATCAAADAGSGFVVGIVGAFLGWGIGAAVGSSKRPDNVKPRSHAKEYPNVKALLSMGWSLGDRPSS